MQTVKILPLFLAITLLATGCGRGRATEGSDTPITSGSFTDLYQNASMMDAITIEELSGRIITDTKGYLPGSEKKAILLLSEEEKGKRPKEWFLKRARDGATVFTGSIPDNAAGMVKLDFTEVIDNGSYYIEIQYYGKSPEFPINKNAYNDTYDALISAAGKMEGTGSAGDIRDRQYKYRLIKEFYPSSKEDDPVDSGFDSIKAGTAGQDPETDKESDKKTDKEPDKEPDNEPDEETLRSLVLRSPPTTTMEEFFHILSYLDSTSDVDTKLCSELMGIITREVEQIVADTKKEPWLVREGSLFEDAVKIALVDYAIKNHEYDTVIENHIHYLRGRNPEGIDKMEEIAGNGRMLPEAILMLRCVMDMN